MLTLAHAPWLDFVDGQRHSLRSALKEAHTLTDLRGNSVLETFALYRFLAAIVQRVYAPKSLDDICAMREIGFFSPAGIETFCGDNLLWLTDFMQVPDLTGDAKSIGYLTFDAPTGSDPVFFQHRAQDKDKAYCQRCVAYGLISLSAWQTIGGQGLTASLNGTPPLYVLPKGSSLFDVLTRCLVPQQTDEIANDWGVWKRRICPHAYPQITYLHGLTFMPRCVKVNWQGSERRCTRCGEATNIWANSMIHKKGEKYTGTDWVDPFVPYREKNGERYPALLKGDVKNLSNNYQPLVQKIIEKTEHKPLIMQQWPEHTAWSVFGTVTNQAKWFDMFQVDFQLEPSLQQE